MAIDLRKDILGDRTKYPDNLVWNLGDGTPVTLAQLRALSTEDQAAISKREGEIEKRRLELEGKDAELKKAQTNTANLYTTLLTAQEAIKAGRMDDPAIKQLFGNQPLPGNNGGSNDPFAALARLENDTLLGPVVAAMKAVALDAKKAQEQVAANVNVQKTMATNYMNGVLEDRYDRIVPADKQDKISLRSLIEDAVKNNEFSSDSTPDIRRAYKRATSADTQAAHDAAVAAAAIKKYQDEHPNLPGSTGSDIFVPQGTNFGLDVHNRSGAAPKPFKNLDEAFAAAAADKDIWANVDKTVQ